jgi:hypothetical protein
MASRRRTRAELLAVLDDEIYFLESASERYDAGKLIESKLLATRIRVLLHQTARSHALINQLGVQDDLTWVDTAGVFDPSNLSPTSGLTLTKMVTGPDGYAAYVPKVEVPQPPPRPLRTKDGGAIAYGSRIPFVDWWTNSVIRDSAREEFSRKQLVLALANQEGGAHYDPEIKAAYAALVDSNSLGWVFSGGSSSAPQPFNGNPVMASVRQIAYEVLESLRNQRDVIDGSTVT